ncbi:MAG: helix-turn-helix transcriptional regulator [Roseiarcus sp.]|jgi:transcriptional regulator with XRE-family HTH domain
MLLPIDQRRLLGAFLRRRREQLRAVDVSLPASRSGRRRTPGLRREEMAQICGMSPTWYAWIEQGRDISVSSAALARLAAAMRLTPAERSYLFELTRKRDPTEPSPGRREEDEPPQALRDALNAMTAPAYLLDRLWRARVERARRAAPQRLAGEWRALSAELRFPRWRARAFIADWENRARRLVAELRADTGRSPDDPSLRALVDRLRTASPDFAAFWSDHAVLTREGGARAFNHPRDGALHYQQVTLTPGGRPDYKLVMLLGPRSPR